MYVKFYRFNIHLALCSITPQSNGVWCSHKVSQSDLIPLISLQRGGVLNPPHESIFPESTFL